MTCPIFPVQRLAVSILMLIFALHATAQADTETLTLSAGMPVMNTEYENVTLTATLSSWKAGDAGTITITDNGLPFVNGATYTQPYTTTITNIYPAKHNFVATYTGTPGNAMGTLTRTYGGTSVVVATPPVGDTYIGGTAVDANTYGPVNIQALEASIGRTVATHLEYAGWFNTKVLLWTDPIGTGQMNTITVTNPGNGTYVASPTVSFTGGGCTVPNCATGVVIVPSDGAGVSQVYVTNAGSGYTSAPTVKISAPNLCSQGKCTQATATASISNGSLSPTVTITTAGAGYSPGPQVSIAPNGGGANATAAASVNGAGSLYHIGITAPGTGYVGAPAVNFSKGSGSGATARAVVDPSGNEIQSVLVTYGGSGYSGSSFPVTFSQGSDVSGTATATVTNGKVTGVTILNGGSGYTPAPVVTITGGGGAGATAVATVGGLGQNIVDDLTNGRIPIVSWAACHLCGQLNGQQVEDIYAPNGNGDGSYIDNIANGLMTLSGQFPNRPIIIRWFWEMNLSGGIGDFSATTQAQRQADYKTAFQFIVNRIRTDFATAGVAYNVVFAFNPGTNLGDTNHATGDMYYPGDQWVDWIALDDYNDKGPLTNMDFQCTVGLVGAVTLPYGCGGVKKNADNLGFYPTYTNASPNGPSNYDKPLMFGENGAEWCLDGSCSGVDVQHGYLQSATAEIPNQFPAFVSYNYFSSTGAANSWELDGQVTGSGGLATYKQMACQAPFLYPATGCN